MAIKTNIKVLAFVEKCRVWFVSAFGFIIYVLLYVCNCNLFYGKCLQFEICSLLLYRFKTKQSGMKKAFPIHF